MHPSPFQALGVRRGALATVATLPFWLAACGGGGDSLVSNLAAGSGSGTTPVVTTPAGTAVTTPTTPTTPTGTGTARGHCVAVWARFTSSLPETSTPA